LIYSSILPMAVKSNKIDIALIVSCHVVGMDHRQRAELTVAKLAEYMDMSVSSLYTRFENESILGLTPAEFLLYVKVIFAQREMTKNPEITVKELAKMLGFSSVRHFIHVFKTIKGFTPGTILTDLRNALAIKRENDRERQAKYRRRQKTQRKNKPV
jgi:AraC-like DNA-binding protein